MRDGYYRVAVGPHDLQLADCPEQLGYPLAADDVVQVIPVVSGAGGGKGLGMAVLGAVLIGTAIVTGGASLTFGASGFGAVSGASIGLSVAAGNIGLGLVLGGVAQMISPQPPSLPEIDNDPRNPANNFGFSGIQQTAREGSTIPVVYGETVVGSIIISQGLNVDQE